MTTNTLHWVFVPEYLYDKSKEKHKQLSVDMNIVIDVTEPIGSEAFNYFHFEGKERSDLLLSEVIPLLRTNPVKKYWWDWM